MYVCMYHSFTFLTYFLSQFVSLALSRCQPLKFAKLGLHLVIARRQMGRRQVVY